MATRNIVPRNDNEGGIGTSVKRWLNSFFKFIDVSDSVKFTPISVPAHDEGKLIYDTVTKSLTFFNDNSDLTLHLGQETIVQAKNNSGVAINNGDVVRISNTGNSIPFVELAQADTKENAKVLGMATVDIPDTTIGYVTIVGLVNNIDTSSFSTGDKLFLSNSVAGGLTTTAPSIEVFVGYVVKSGTTDGAVFLNTAFPSESVGDMQKSTYDTDDDGIVDQALPTDFQYTEDNTESSTTSTSYQDKLSLTFTPPASGDYIIDWYAELGNSTGDKRIDIRVLEDATTVVETSVSPKQDNTLEFNSVSGFIKRSLTNVSVTFKIQFKASANTAFIKNARLMAKRIS